VRLSVAVLAAIAAWLIAAPSVAVEIAPGLTYDSSDVGHSATTVAVASNMDSPTWDASRDKGFIYDFSPYLYATNTAGSGPVTFRPPPGATAEEIAQVQAYVEGCNAALCAGELSPTGRVSTSGALRADASSAAAAERARAAAAGSPYSGHVGHVPDTTWTGSATPPSWMDLTPRVNMSLGGQAVHYPIGYRPTVFEFLDGLG